MAEMDVASGEVTVSVGDLVRVRLPEATTGHVWAIAGLGHGLTLLVERYERTADISPGRASEHVFELRAEQPGEWAADLRLARQWESVPLEERRIVVRVS